MARSLLTTGQRRTPAAVQNRYRLDRAIEPRAYAIELEPDLSRFTFKGHERITIHPARPFSKITLHAAELLITKAVLRSATGTPLRANHITYEKALETATLHFSSRLPAGRELTLELDFEGILNDKMHGFYRTSYQVNGQQRWGAATQFEATDARRSEEHTSELQSQR